MVKAKSGFVLTIFLMLLLSPLAAQGKSKSVDVNKRSGDVGFLFNFQNLLTNILVYNDGFQSGFGAKYWLNDKLALRGLLGFYFNSYTASGETTADTSSVFSLGAGMEFHPRKDVISPYLGGFLGTKLEKWVDVTSAGFYGGAMAGVEYLIAKGVSLFGEYQLSITFDSNGTTVSLADSSDGAIFGICIYF